MGQFEDWGWSSSDSAVAGGTVDAVARADAAAAQADANTNTAAIAALEANGVNHPPVADITARDALTADTGDRVFVVDASADGTVDAGAASYVYDGAAWIKYAEAESLDVAAMGITQGNSTATSSYTQSFADNGQTWDNLVSWTINQEISAFPGNYGATTLETGALNIDTFGSPGVNGDHLIGSSEVRFDLNAGTEERDIRADNTSVRLAAATSTNTNKSSQLDVANQGIDLQFGTESDLRLNGNPGVAGQVPISAGPDLPPIWGAAAAGIVDVRVEIKDSADAGTVKFADAGDGFFEYVIAQADHGVPVGKRAQISVYDPSDDSLVDSIVVRHAVASGDITIRSLADVAVDVEILGAAS